LTSPRATPRPHARAAPLRATFRCNTPLEQDACQPSIDQHRPAHTGDATKLCARPRFAARDRWCSLSASLDNHASLASVASHACQTFQRVRSTTCVPPRSTERHLAPSMPSQSSGAVDRVTSAAMLFRVLAKRGAPRRDPAPTRDPHRILFWKQRSRASTKTTHEQPTKSERVHESANRAPALTRLCVLRE